MAVDLRGARFLLGLTFVAVAPSLCRAGQVTVRVSGTVTGGSMSGGPFSGAGPSSPIQLKFDLFTPGTVVSASLTRYDVDPATFVLRVNGTDAPLGAAFPTFDMSNAAPVADGVSLPAVPVQGGPTVSFSFTDCSGTIFQSTDALMNLGTWTGTSFYCSGSLNVSGFGALLANLNQFSLAYPDFAANSCIGDGSGTQCPCGNNSPPAFGAGCSHSVFSSGARLRAQGLPRITQDLVTLRADSLPPGTSGLFFQGTPTNAVAFGDGLRCVSGPITRIGVAFADASFVATYPNASTPIPLSVAGQCSAGQTSSYQFWYRDTNTTFCTAATFNLTNSTVFTWAN